MEGEGGGGAPVGLCDSFKLLWQNSDLVKVVLAAGLLAASTVMSPIQTLVLVELRSDIWADHMAEYSAMVNSANGIVAMIFSGYFGRWGDTVDRRGAMVAVGVLAFVPSWALLLFGQTSAGLNAYSLLSVLGGVACITVTGCPTCYALVTDVIPAGDRELAFGCVFAGVVFVAIAGNVGGLMVNAFFGGDSRAIVLYVCVLELLYFFAVGLVRLPTTRAGGSCAVAGEEELGAEHVDSGSVGDAISATVFGSDVVGEGRPPGVSPPTVSAPLPPPLTHTARPLRLEGGAAAWCPAVADELATYDSDTSTSCSEGGGSSSSSSVDGESGRKVRRRMLLKCLAPLQLVLDDPSLRSLCVVAALASLPEITLTDVSQQFAMAQFELIASHNGNKQKEVTLLFQWPGFALLLPAFFLVGMYSKRVGALRALRLLIPVTGACLSLPVLLRYFPRMWLVPITGVSVPVAMVVFAPLQTLITQVAPPDRVGEAMGSVGASKQVAGLVSNLLVSFMVPILVESGIKKPLWIFYPFASCSSFLALCFACQIKVRDDPPSGAAEDGSREQGADPRQCRTYAPGASGFGRLVKSGRALPGGAATM